MDDFRFELTQEERAYLKSLVRASIAAGLNGRKLANVPEPPTPRLADPLGAFVTLKLGGQLRGCIGSIQPDAPLNQTIADMAQAAAFQDPRFPPVNLREAEALEVEVSVLSPVAPCPDPARVEPGRHGLIVRRGANQGLLLPQVATEWGWDGPTFWSQTCVKAGLPEDCWQQPGTELYWFQAEVF